jgi:hypothetical protein
VPALLFWPGAALILAASVFILQRETRSRGKVLDETVPTAA